MSAMVDFIEAKRDGKAHTSGDLQAFVDAVRDQAVPDYQVAAWLMAVYFKGLNGRELADFTRFVAFSGDTVKLAGDKRTVDKHSTGGVGDKTTLVVAPIVAACGVDVAKLSGRGLGFTGGTVDKLEAIPGMDMHLPAERFISQVDSLGLALSGHSLELAPAEGRFYALRDVTGTVPSLSLIASSIVSKKVAGGADAFVFDVKCGSGAFMRTYAEAEALARVLVDLSGTLGKRSVCLISDMEQPLGEWIGNAVEVFEAIEVLLNRGPEDTRTLSIALAAEMLLLAGVSADLNEATECAAKALRSGSALEKFADVVAAQGGDADVCRNPERVLPSAAFMHTITATEDGLVEKVDAGTIGNAVRALGGGRLRKEDDIDPSVGLRLYKKIGDRVWKGEPLAEIHYNSTKQLEASRSLVESAYSIGCKPTSATLLRGRVS